MAIDYKISQSTTVALLGCGWLGKPLAHCLMHAQYTVKPSVTTQEKADSLGGELGIRVFPVNATATGVTGDMDEFLAGAGILIINIPPRAASGPFEEVTRQILPYIERSRVEKVLFISSTSVYGVAGPTITEDTIPVPETENAVQLRAAEQLLQGNSAFGTTILRFGGLTGGDRHPVKHLAGRKAVADPDAPVNLIHRHDCTGLILTILQQEAWGQVFNGVDPYHPSRKEYYTRCARELGLEPPQFETFGGAGKTVLSPKAESVLGYKFTGRI